MCILLEEVFGDNGGWVKAVGIVPVLDCVGEISANCRRANPALEGTNLLFSKDDFDMYELEGE